MLYVYLSYPYLSNHEEKPHENPEIHKKHKKDAFYALSDALDPNSEGRADQHERVQKRAPFWRDLFRKMRGKPQPRPPPDTPPPLPPRPNLESTQPQISPEAKRKHLEAGKTPDEVRKILRDLKILGEFDTISGDMRNLLSYTLCRPKERLDVNGFIKELEKIEQKKKDEDNKDRQRKKDKKKKQEEQQEEQQYQQFLENRRNWVAQNFPERRIT